MRTPQDIVERWNPDIHLSLINEWHEQWGYPTWSAEIHPATGFIVNKVIVGFIFKSDAAICTIDGFISKKRTPRDQLKHAMEVLCDELVEEATRQKMFAVQLYTNIPSLIQNAVRHHFVKVGERHTHMVRRFA